jgi:hypothetical protein
MDNGYFRFVLQLSATLLIGFVVIATNNIVKVLNYERHVGFVPQRYTVTPWSFVKGMVDIGYIVAVVALPTLFTPDLNARRLIVMCVTVTTIMLIAFIPYCFVRRVAYIFISDTCFEIKIQTLYYNVCEKISFEQMKALDLTKKKIIFHMKEGNDIVLPKNALIAFRGYNMVIDKLDSLARR